MTKSWKNFTNGSIADVGIWDNSLTEDEFSKIYTDGITNKDGKFLTSNVPVVYYSFDCGYDKMIFELIHKLTIVSFEIDVEKKQVDELNCVYRQVEMLEEMVHKRPLFASTVLHPDETNVRNL